MFLTWNITPVYFGAGQSGLQTSRVVSCEIWPHRLKGHSPIFFYYFCGLTVRNGVTATSAVTIRKSALCHIVFVWHVSHKKNVISLNKNKRLIFIIDKNCVLSEARTEFYMSGRTWVLKALDGADGRRPLSAESWVCSQENGCVICGRRSDTGTDFSQIISVLPCHSYSTDVP